MFCSHCGKEISSNDNFCKYCGNKIEYKNIGDSASETKSPKTKKSSKPIIIGGILGLMLCVFFVVFFVVYSQKNKSSNLNKTDSKLSSEEAIVADVKTAGRLQSATQAALADERAYAAVCKFCGNDWNDDVLIMTINKNGEYIYSEDLNIFAEEFKSKNNYGNNDDKISIKYTEKGADSFNIYITPQGGVCIYIGSKDEPRKWKVVPFKEADTLYRVNIEEENLNKEEASEIKSIETIDDEVYLYNMVVNYSADDIETNYELLDANKPRYYHFSIGIPSKKSIKLYGGTTDSTGYSGYVDFVSESYDGESDFICMNSPIKTSSGTERVRIYRSDTSEILYEFVVNLYNDKPSSDPEMLFPNCIVEYIPENEVKKLTKDQVQEVINDIYAKYGYIFKDKELREHYSQFSWYVERADADHFHEEVFDEVAKANLELLKRYR